MTSPPPNRLSTISGKRTIGMLNSALIPPRASRPPTTRLRTANRKAASGDPESSAPSSSTTGGSGRSLSSSRVVTAVVAAVRAKTGAGPARASSTPPRKGAATEPISPVREIRAPAAGSWSGRTRVGATAIRAVTLTPVASPSHATHR
ncbi:hypothetical protein AWI43_23585 [Streptomyces sp. WAC04657]|nr:hypothetical protein AWI43_23585 [Streptomyces sp. WAC04657]